MTMNRFLALLLFGLIMIGLGLALLWALGRKDTHVVQVLLLLMVAVTLVWFEVHDRLGRQLRWKRAGPPPLGEPLLIRAQPSEPGSLMSDLEPLLSAEHDAARPAHHQADSMYDPCSPVAQATSTPECSSPPGDSGSP